MNRVHALACIATLFITGCGGGGGSSGEQVAAPLKISTTSLANGQVGQAYRVPLSSSGGTPPYEWSVSSGALPAGLVLSSDGVISGTPTVSASASFTIEVKDSGAPVAQSTRTFTLTVLPVPLAIGTSELPSVIEGTPYSASLSASGGTPPYAWSILQGSLPPGLSLSSSGVIAGTATGTASGPVTFQVSDASSPRLTKTVQLSITVNPAPLQIASTGLPNGQVGHAFAALLSATGGVAPYAWALSSGTLPAGLTLNAASGSITGTPTASANGSSLSFTVSDSSAVVQQRSITLTLNVSPANISVSISPRALGLTVGQTTSLTVSTNDYAGVRWSVSAAGATVKPSTSVSGGAVLFSAPSSAGVYTVTATSVTDPAQSANLLVGVTDLPGVLSYHDDAARDGLNAQEYALTPANVNTSSFGKLFSCAVDGAVYAQPLWMANLPVSGAAHNVVFVATQRDSLYAFDADTSPCTLLWHVSLIDAAHGGTPGESSVPSGVDDYLVGSGDGDITPEVGVTGTPVIDPISGILYVVSKSVNAAASPALFHQQLHAIDVTTGQEKAGSPVAIQASYPGTGDGSSSVTFNAQTQNQRSGLALVNGTVYIAWASHEDTSPYYGWVMGYQYGAGGFTQTAVLNVTPNVQKGGIWMSGAAPSVDPAGNLYLITGNGHFDANSLVPPDNDYGDSLLELLVAAQPMPASSALSIPGYFTPSDQANDAQNDVDFGSGGAAVLADVTYGNPSTTMHLVMGGGKDGNFYLLNRDELGGYGDAHAWQKIQLGGPIYSTPAFFNNSIYVNAAGQRLTLYVLDTSQTPAQFVRQSSAASPSGGFAWPGTTPAISATGTANALVWAVDSSQYCTHQASGCGPAVLHAYDATDLMELWNSSLAAGGADAAGNAVKFVVPTVANGKVYVGTRGADTGTAEAGAASGELDVYGLKAQ